VTSPDELSLAQQIALLPETRREEALAGLDPTRLQWDADFWLRPAQILPMDNSWDLAVMLAGRGFGKTYAGCQWVRKMARSQPGSYGLICARTAADARDVLVNGPSGILAVSPPDERPLYESSKRKLTWPNGTTALLFTSEVPDALRGPAGNWALADELATWDMHPDESGLNAWQNLTIATRLGENPKIVTMTTPKRVPHIKELVARATADPRVLLRRGRTTDNAGNLAQAYLDTIYGLYAGTSLAAQELEGELLGDVEGALWTDLTLANSRLAALPPLDELGRLVVVIGVDPSVAAGVGDEVGIVIVVGTTHPNPAERHIFVLEDHSGQLSPAEWARTVAELARRWGALVIAETNQGGQLVIDAIRNVDPLVRVVGVHARIGKALRAEPVALASEQGRVHMVGVLPLLESEMTTWEPARSSRSPNRLDAFVYAALGIIGTDAEKITASGGPLRITNNASRRRLAVSARRIDSNIPVWQQDSIRGMFGR
jgi:phage terminase large subunit-like protein